MQQKVEKKLHGLKLIIMKDLKNYLRKKSIPKKILKKEEHRLILRKTFQHILHHAMYYVYSLKWSDKNLEFNN